MSIATGVSPIQPEPQLAGQTVVAIGGSAGIGLETTRRARAEGAKRIVFTGSGWNELRSPGNALRA